MENSEITSQTQNSHTRLTKLKGDSQITFKTNAKED